MCIAIYKPKNVLIFEDTLKQCWETNPHGAGFMYPNKGKLIINKGHMTYEEFQTAFEPHKDKACVLHFRIATHGETNQANTHPFQVTEKLGLVHNGIINHVACDINKTMSDTWHFVEKYVKPLAKLWRTEAIRGLYEEYIGYSKLIMMDGAGNVEIIKENLGIWDSGCWFSNTTYKAYQYSPRYQKPKKYQPNLTLHKPQQKMMVAGDIVTLSHDAIVDIPDYTSETIGRGTKVKISYFAAGNQVCVENPINHKTARVPVWQLITENTQDPAPIACGLEMHVEVFKFADDVIFTKNYNHFRVGDIVTIARVGTHHLICHETDTMSNKQFSIPRTHVKPLKTLFH